ncbi:MAG: transposase, partial [Wolbachia endosymbiont of Melophagus ovinus]|nr:transposase [Wolbachia endosymbiont of Melophagus ovinus]
AYEELNRFNWSEKEFIAYEQEIKRIRDEKAVLAQKLDDARDEGIQIGEERGRQEGIKIGAKKGKIEVAKNLLKAGVSVDLITESTGLPKAEIAQLKEEVTS